MKRLSLREPAAGVTFAQPRPTTPKKLKSPTVVRGFIGGESHDAYVIRAGKGVAQ
jgi:hypothetical protein